MRMPSNDKKAKYEPGTQRIKVIKRINNKKNKKNK
jgi:hypothetical protein